MNLLEEVCKPRSLKLRDKVVRYVGNNKRRFAALVKIYLDCPPQAVQTVASALGCAAEAYPELMVPHLNSLLKQTLKPVHEAFKRNTMRSLQYLEVPPAYYGKVFDTCFRLFTDRTEPIAVRVFAMTVMSKIAMKVPELRNELVLAIEDELPYGSAAYIHRGKRELKKLKG